MGLARGIQLGVPVDVGQRTSTIILKSEKHRPPLYLTINVFNIRKLLTREPEMARGRFAGGPQQVDLWVRVMHVCVGTAACPGTADFRPCAPQAKNYRFVPFGIINAPISGGGGGELFS
jgi:hypothetical protein